MTPDERAMLIEMYEWMRAKQAQQISEPLDEASRNALHVPVLAGPGSTSRTQGITVPSAGGTITVPATPIGSIILEAEGARYEIPYLATP